MVTDTDTGVSDAGVSGTGERDAGVGDAARPSTPAEQRHRAPGRALLGRTLRSCRRDLIAASALFTSHQLGESLVPVIIGAVIADAVAHGGTVRIVLWLLVLAVDFAFLSTSYRFGARASARARQAGAHQARLWLTARVLSPDGGVDLAPGDLVSRAGSDCGRVGAFAGVVALAVSRIGVLLVATVVLLVLSPLLGVVILLGTVVLLLVQDRVARRLQRRSGVEQAQAADATAAAEDLVRGLRVLKGIGATRTATAEYTRLSERAVSSALASASAQSLLDAVAAALTGLYLAVVAGLGGWLALRGHLGVGALVSALGLARFVIDPMQLVAGIHGGYARALASAARIQQLLDLPPAVADGNDPTPDGPSEPVGIEVQAVPLRGRPVSFRAAPGRLTGVVTGVPADAAALAALLGRERDPVAGTIRLGGRELPRWPLARLRSVLLVAPHDATLLPGTVEQNVAVRAAADTGEAMRAALADQVVQVLPEGAATDVGDRGENLSGGQRQRIALARALAADPPALVLHDPTTSVDAATEDRIADRLRARRAGRTTVLITASPALLSRCDDVVFLDGDVRTGTHAQLSAAADYLRTVTR